MDWGSQEVETFREELTRGLQWLGVNESSETMVAMVDYARRLAAASSRQNLTSIERPEAVAWKHFIDSLVGWQAYQRWRERQRGGAGRQARFLADLGAGAGFPGLVWALIDPWQVVEIEAEAGKAAFLESLADLIGTERLLVFHGRAEEAARRAEWRGRFDVVVARALGRLDVVAEYGMPLLRLGGALVAYKGPRAEEETALLGGDVRQGLGITAVESSWVEMPAGLGRRCVVILEKGADSEEIYPRRTGVPEKRPLGGGRRKGQGGERV